MTESELNSRIEICKHCPINANGQCTNKLCLNPKTNEISTKFKEGFFRGCGCRLNAKTRLINAKCPAGKW